jgi:CxC1 like cysteine cluster associated with KDZ transposases
MNITGLEKISLCTCKEPALQLLQHGFFPCAPQQPSLAVDLGVLDFAHDLFINAAPNTTAWCETLEGFLSARHFKLSTRVRIFIMKEFLYTDVLLKIGQPTWPIWKCFEVVCYTNKHQEFETTGLFKYCTWCSVINGG